MHAQIRPADLAVIVTHARAYVPDALDRASSHGWLALDSDEYLALCYVIESLYEHFDDMPDSAIDDIVDAATNIHHPTIILD